MPISYHDQKKIDAIELAKHKYAVYGADADNKSWDGREMPAWDNLGNAVQHHWMAVALDEINRREELVKKIRDLVLYPFVNS